MSRPALQLEQFLAAQPCSVLVRLDAVRGSAPREAGAYMVVAPDAQFGTIGGGQLEFSMVQHARNMIRNNWDRDRLAVPLGPGIGQCCGGHVDVDFANLSGPMAADLLDGARAAEAAQTPALIFGGGHVGRALAQAFSLLPISVQVIDTRRDALLGLPDGVSGILSAMPESQVRAAPAGAVYVAVTHDHALDFLVTGEALHRGDAAYVGMISSKTKRAQFRHWFLENDGDEALLEALISPIGGTQVADKRPEIIAALTAAEILVKLGQSGCLNPSGSPERAGAEKG